MEGLLVDKLKFLNTGLNTLIIGLVQKKLGWNFAQMWKMKMKKEYFGWKSQNFEKKKN